MLSAIILIGVIAMLYYKREVQLQHDQCSVNMINAARFVEMDIKNAYLSQDKLSLHTENYKYNVGLFDFKHQKIFSNLTSDATAFSKEAYTTGHHSFYIQTLAEPIEDIKYIVIENNNGEAYLFRLKLLILFTILGAVLFIAVIGYYLSKILLKPVHERIKQIDRFIKDSAHEINTPVSALLMSVSALQKKGLEQDKLLNHIAISSKQISEIYNSLSHIAFSDLEEPEKGTTFNLAHVTKESIAFYKEIAASKKITIISDLEITYVHMGKNGAKKVINNLLSNAVKYNYPGKNIYITLHQGILSIKDEGIGIDKKNLEDILKRYKRASKVAGGFGIGLDIVNEICKTYHIRLSIKSQKKKGSLFQLDFSNIVATDIG